jgi:hypothetical protein
LRGSAREERFPSKRTGEIGRRESRAKKKGERKKKKKEEKQNKKSREQAEGIQGIGYIEVQVDGYASLLGLALGEFSKKKKKFLKKK